MTLTNPETKKPRIEFVILSGLIIVTRAADLFSTYLLTPDLDYESNPFVKVFGARWLGFIAIQVIFLLLVMGANYYSLFRAKMVYPPKGGLSFIEFQRFYMFGDGNIKERVSARLLWILRIHVGFVGYLLPRILIIYSTAIVIIHAMMYNGKPVPQNYIFIFYGALLLGVLVLNKLFHFAHYRVYKRITG